MGKIRNIELENKLNRKLRTYVGQLFEVERYDWREYAETFRVYYVKSRNALEVKLVPIRKESVEDYTKRLTTILLTAYAYVANVHCELTVCRVLGTYKDNYVMDYDECRFDVCSLDIILEQVARELTIVKLSKKFESAPVHSTACVIELLDFFIKYADTETQSAILTDKLFGTLV